MTTINTILKIIKNGEIEYEQEAKSWLKNFFYFLSGILSLTNVNLIDVDGVARTINISGQIVSLTSHIALGTDNTPPTFAEYKLKNEIFSSQFMFDYVLITNGIKLRFYVQYTPSQAIDIWEIGLKMSLLDTGSARRYVLALRDVFSQASHHEPNESKIYMIEVSIVA